MKKDKAISCSSSEVVYPMGKYDQTTFNHVLKKFQPTGYTPLALAIRSAQQDLQSVQKENTQNIIYIVSDGIETCGGNPVEEAKKLHNSGIQAVVNIIGFDVDNAGQQAPALKSSSTMDCADFYISAGWFLCCKKS